MRKNLVKKDIEGSNELTLLSNQNLKGKNNKLDLAEEDWLLIGKPLPTDNCNLTITATSPNTASLLGQDTNKESCSECILV